MTAAVDLVLQVAGVVICAGVVVGCICRIDLMRAGRHKAGWLLMYLCAAPFAGGVLIDLATDRPVDWYCSLGIATVALHLVLTRGLWRRGPPPETMRSPP